MALADAGCGGVARTAYYDTLERFGREKRHILRDRVEGGRESQREAQEQFRTTYERFREATGASAGADLEEIYRRLQSEYDRSEMRAAEVHDRIASIERVAADLFEEWEQEIDQIGDAALRAASARRHGETRTRYGDFIDAMNAAARRMEPVLGAFRDQVLFLKHNLNASAIAALERNVVSIERDVDALIVEMETSIREADAFLLQFDGSGSI